MKSRYLINFALIGFVLGLYCLLNQEPSIAPQQTVAALSQKDVSEITITRYGLDTITLQKIASNWQITQPLQAPANTTRVKLLLSILNTTSHAQLSHADNSTLNQLGFNETSTLLQLNNNSFQFGEVESISQRRYVLHNDIIHLINDNVSPLLRANAASFIDNKLTPVGVAISKLSIPTLINEQILSTDNIIIEQKEGHWTSDKENISSDQLIILIDAWQHAYALQVLPLEKAKLPSSEPQKIFIWYQHQTSPLELELQHDDSTLYLNNRVQQLSYQFPISLMPTLLLKNP